MNNAGAIPTGDIFSIDETRWREAWDLKVFGYVNLMRAMYRHMRGRPPKAIVNVLGLGGEKPQWHYVCGNAANVALMGVTKSLGGRSIDDGIRVVGVNPGGVETERMITNQQESAPSATSATPSAGASSSPTSRSGAPPRRRRSPTWWCSWPRSAPAGSAERWSRSTAASSTATAGSSSSSASAPFPKFAIRFGTLLHELRKPRGTSNSMFLVPLFDLKFLTEFAASGVGTSNRRH